MIEHAGSPSTVLQVQGSNGLWLDAPVDNAEGVVVLVGAMLSDLLPLDVPPTQHRVVHSHLRLGTCDDLSCSQTGVYLHHNAGKLSSLQELKEVSVSQHSRYSLTFFYTVFSAC